MRVGVHVLVIVSTFVCGGRNRGDEEMEKERGRRKKV